jgi:chromosomal replication initiator protein
MLNATSLIHEVQETVARVFDLTRADLLSRSRRRPVAQARQLAMYLCRDLAQEEALGKGERCWASFPRIGIAFSRDHTSVLHAYQTVENRRRQDREFARMVDQIERELVARRHLGAEVNQ